MYPAQEKVLCAHPAWGKASAHTPYVQAQDKASAYTHTHGIWILHGAQRAPDLGAGSGRHVYGSLIYHL